MKSPAFDYQRSRLYRWERERYNHSPMNRAVSLAEAAALVRELTGLNVPIRAGRRDSGQAYASGPLWLIPGKPAPVSITLPPRLQLLWVVVHEAAHVTTFDHHGPNFAARLCDYLARVGLGDRAELVASARAAGLGVSDGDPPLLAFDVVREPEQKDLFQASGMALTARLPSIPMPRRKFIKLRRDLARWERLDAQESLL